MPHLRTAAFGLLCLLLAHSAWSAEENPPIAVTVYYSAEDPRWPETEKAIEAVRQKYPQLQCAKIAIDTPEGYAQLHAAEKALAIDPTGDTTLVMGPVCLTSQGERRGIEMYFGPMIAQILNPDAKKGWRKIDAAPYARELFGADATVHAQPADEKTLGAWYRVLRNGQPAGWVVDIFRKIGCPVCTDTQFLLAVKSPELRVLDVRPVRDLERLGLPVPPKETAPFLKQFKDATPGSGTGTGTGKRRVDIVSGATKTSHAYESAIEEVLQELKLREKK